MKQEREIDIAILFNLNISYLNDMDIGYTEIRVKTKGPALNTGVEHT